MVQIGLKMMFLLSNLQSCKKALSERMEASSFLMVLKKIIRKSEIVLIITYLLTGNGGSEPYHRNHFYRDEKKS